MVPPEPNNGALDSSRKGFSGESGRQRSNGGNDWKAAVDGDGWIGSAPDCKAERALAYAQFVFSQRP